MSTISRRTFIKQTGGLAILPFIKERPQHILYNGNIITINPDQPTVQAVAIANNHFLAAGSDAEIRAMASPLTESINLGGKTVVPGFIDSHSHPGSAGRRHLTDIDCELPSIEAIKEAVYQRSLTTPPGEWIFGFKYDDTKIREGRYLNRQDLDEAAPTHPVQITHRGGHSTFVNSMAFEKVGVNEYTPNPDGGEFVRTSGKLSGRVLETANSVFNGIRPKVTHQTYIDGVKLISEKLAKSGITSVHDAGGSPKDLDAYQEAYSAGLLKTRIYCHIRGGHLDKMIAAGVRTGLGDEWVKVGPMKTAIDGSISERTARLSEPYIGSPGYYGILTSTTEAIYEISRKAHAAGWQIGVHANGDVAIDQTLGIFERLLKEMPKRDPRFRIEHCTVINDELIRRIKEIGAIPNPFSTYVYFHGEKMKYYGHDRLNNMFALRSFLDAGIKVTQTSDYPPGPFEPMMALQSSVTRTDYNGTLWGPKQRITVAEALKIGTLHGAYASFEENIKGSIQAGKLADLVVLGQDPTKIDPFGIIDIKIERTMVGGYWVYES